MKTKSFSRVAIAILIMITPLMFSLKNVWADDDDINTSMFITPMQQEILLTPGEQYQGALLISNGKDAKNTLDYNIKIGSYNLSRSEDGTYDYNGLDVDSRTQYNIMMDWIKLEKDSGKLEPGTQEKVLFTIDVPETAPAGAQYASILVTNDTDNDEEGNDEGNDIMIKSITRLASTIIANVAGETVEKGSISDNSIPSFLLNNQLEATSIVRNDGNVYTDAEYILQVWPLFSDEEICTNEEKPETSLVLPETERHHSQSCALPSVGIFRAKQTVKIFGEESIVEKTIIVCPIWLLFIIFFVIAAIIIWLVMRARSRKSTNSRKTSAE